MRIIQKGRCYTVQCSGLVYSFITFVILLYFKFNYIHIKTSTFLLFFLMFFSFF
ncbi:hypothetical protein EAPG_00624 [Escherichia albertii B156]|nr:hypothetical protein EAPG_00624 [Escherichia albertii B156]